MIDLGATLGTVRSALDAIKQYLDGLTSSSLNPIQTRWVAHWQLKANRLDHVDNILEDIQKRSIAYDALKNFQIPTGGVAPWRVNYGTLPVDSKVARHFYVASYLAITWSIYDSTYDLFSRLAGAGIEMLNEQPGKNKKLSELFDGNKKDRAMVHCGLDELFRDSYWWIHKVGYSFRNAFLHEGGRFNGEAILQGSIAADFFDISQDTKEYFDNIRSDNAFKDLYAKCILHSRVRRVPTLHNPATSSRPTTPPIPGFEKPLWEMLDMYNSHLDEMMAHMIVWATNSYKTQVETMLGTSTGSPEATIVNASASSVSV